MISYEGTQTRFVGSSDSHIKKLVSINLQIKTGFFMGGFRVI